MTKITIELRGGIVQAILGIPEGVTVIVRDYDVEGSEEQFDVDENGEKYIRSVWP